MRLLSSKFVVVAAGTVMACGDATAPGSIPGVFVLRTVNGRSLPFTAGGPTIDPSHSVLSGTVTLDGTGTATLVERRLFFGNPNSEQTATRVLPYRIDKHRIIIDPTDCPPSALCAHITGVIINFDLSLDSPFANGFTYLYHRAAEHDGPSTQ